jgi:hypothetical protein
VLLQQLGNFEVDVECRAVVTHEVGDATRTCALAGGDHRTGPSVQEKPMAEINVQRRPANPVWWIVGVIAMLIVIWAIFAWVGNDTGQYGVGRTSVEEQTLASLASTTGMP